MAEHAPSIKQIDGFLLGERVHSGAMGYIHRVSGRETGFPMIMKIPRVGAGESGEGLLAFETEAMIMPVLKGPYIPRFVAAGDLAKTPYLVVEWVDGKSLQKLMTDNGCFSAQDVARTGAAIADALHSLHRQDTIHLDIKPDNIIRRPDGAVVLVDFGLAHHARFPDLLAEEMRYASGSTPYISPEQLYDTRSDPRSDLYSLGVVLYEMATAQLPFGVPETLAGMRNRLWLDPVPPCEHQAGIPPWLQEVILRCLEPQAANRYQSAAHVAFDLRHPDQVRLTSRAAKSGRAGVFAQAKRWWGARGERTAPRSLPTVRIGTAPVIMVAVDTTHPDDERQPAIRRATAQVLSLSAEFRLICVAVIRAEIPAASDLDGRIPYDAHLDHRVRLRNWVDPLKMPANRLSLHVIESPNPASMLLEFARRNNVDLIVIGAPGPTQQALAWWRSVASGVTAGAHCSVYVVRVAGRHGDDGKLF